MRCYRTLLLLLLALSVPWLFAQSNDILTARAKGPVVAARGKQVQVPVSVALKQGYHVNSTRPRDKYLIPLKLSWEAGSLQAGATTFPDPGLHTYKFSDEPLSVYEKDFVIQQTFLVKPDAPQGFGAITGKLRYQACTETECLPPATATIRVSYDIR